MKVFRPVSTIYIHGTLPSKKLYLIPYFDHFFHCPDGLVAVENVEKRYHHRQLLESLAHADPKNFHFSHMYLYGWSGDLSFSARHEESYRLYHSLKHINGPLRIITHSHGGNIALKLASVVEEYHDEVFSIEQLILLACPVQRQTLSFSASPLFKKIYSFHSHADIFQVIDPQGLYELIALYQTSAFKHLFSSFRSMESFFSVRHFPISNDLKQINVLHQGRGLLHVEFMMIKFMKILPVLMRYISMQPESDYLGDELIIDTGNFHLDGTR